MRRELNLLDAVGVGLGAIIGAGLFVVSGLAVQVAGRDVALALLIASLVATCNALSSAELAARYPTSGGTYEYATQKISPLAGFAAGWLFLVSKTAAAAAVATGLGQYVHSLNPQIPPLTVVLASILLVTTANLLGIKKAGRLNLAILAITLFGLLFFAVTAAPRLSPESLTPTLATPPRELLAAAAIIFFSFTGYARIATLAEEVKDPALTIPRAVIITLVAATLLYLVVILSAVATLGVQPYGQSPAPLHAAADALRQPALSAAITLSAGTAMLGVLLSQILGISRVTVAMARRSDLPPALGRLHPQSALPVTAILSTAAVILGLALLEIRLTVTLATFSILVYYALANLAALRLPKAEKRFPSAIAVIGLASCIALSATLPASAFLPASVSLAAGLILRTLLHRRCPPSNPGPTPTR